MLNKINNNFEFIFSTRYKKPGGSDDDTFLTLIGNYFFSLLCKILFRLNISDVLFTYVMGRTNAFKSLKLISNDFTFCVELPIKANRSNQKMISFTSEERSRIAGRKKVNAFKDGLKILFSMINLFFRN